LNSAARDAPHVLGARRAAWIFLVFVAVQLAIGFLVAFFAAVIYGALRWSAQHNAGAEAARLATIPAAILGMVIAACVVAFMAGPGRAGETRREAFAAIGWRVAPAPQLARGALAGGLLAISFLTLTALFFPPPGPETWGPMMRALSSGGVPFYLWSFLALAIAPVAEEFVFRGVLFDGFSQSWGAFPAAIAVTALFLSTHLSEAWSYPPALVSIATLGILTLVARVRTHSLMPGMALHFTYNLGIVLATFAQGRALS
jgi:membrane protease YdiL (CAAX protease family)